MIHHSSWLLIVALLCSGDLFCGTCLMVSGDPIIVYLSVSLSFECWSSPLQFCIQDIVNNLTVLSSWLSGGNHFLWSVIPELVQGFSWQRPNHIFVGTFFPNCDSPSKATCSGMLTWSRPILLIKLQLHSHQILRILATWQLCFHIWTDVCPVPLLWGS